MNLKKESGRSMDMYLPEEPTHCAQCGDVMVRGKIKPWVSAYNSDGTPNHATQHTLKCNKQSTWWKELFCWTYHEQFLVVDHPHGYSPWDNGKPHRSILQTIKLGP